MSTLSLASSTVTVRIDDNGGPAAWLCAVLLMGLYRTLSWFYYGYDGFLILLLLGVVSFCFFAPDLPFICFIGESNFWLPVAMRLFLVIERDDLIMAEDFVGLCC